MIEQNIEFQEQYKKLDNLCKDCYNSREGVSEYIKQMDNCWLQGAKLVNEWEYLYKMLKHVRWIRNQLAHEVGTLNSDIVEEKDLLFVCDFYNKILHVEDPLSIMRKNQNSQKQKTIQPHPTTPSNTIYQQKDNQSFLSKIFNKLKKLFK